MTSEEALEGRKRGGKDNVGGEHSGQSLGGSKGRCLSCSQEEEARGRDLSEGRKAGWEGVAWRPREKQAQAQAPW